MTETQNQVIFDINNAVLQTDIDVLELFLSNKNQTGPNGDILKFELDEKTNKKLTVFYENAEAKEIIIGKKFFTFKDYFIRSSEVGYKFEIYKADPNYLILTNIQSDKENCKVELFGEYILPDNPIVEIKKSKFFINTFYILYKNQIDKDLVEKRYLKKQNVLKTEIKYLNTFQTSTVLIRYFQGHTNVKELMKKLTSDIYSKLGTKPNIFLDQAANFLAVQFKSELDTNKFLESIKDYLFDNKLSSEYLYNFELIENKPQINTSEKKIQGEVKILQNQNSSNEQYETVYACFNDHLNNVSIRDSPDKFSIQITHEKNAKLATCLFNCAKILFDFKRDVETSLSSSKLYMRKTSNELKANFDVVFKKKQFDPISENLIMNLIGSYENERIKYDRIELDKLFKNSKGNISLLMDSFTQKKELENFKSKLNIYISSIKCIYVQYDKLNYCFEIYGYAQAIKCFTDYFNILVNKTIKLTEHKNTDKMNLTLKNPRVDIFHKFTGQYFNHFQKKLADFKAKTTLKKDNTIEVTADNFSDWTEASDKEITLWKNQIEQFFKVYLLQFDNVRFNVNFRRDSDQANRLIYDKNSLDIKWSKYERDIQVLGIKTSINDLQQRIYE